MEYINTIKHLEDRDIDYNYIVISDYFVYNKKVKKDYIFILVNINQKAKVHDLGFKLIDKTFKKGLLKQCNYIEKQHFNENKNKLVEVLKIKKHSIFAPKKDNKIVYINN